MLKVHMKLYSFLKNILKVTHYIMKALKAIVSGKVQGVWFRDSTCKEASKLNIVGWVKNLADGTVEVRAEGNENDLRALVKWLHIGSTRSSVNKVDVEWMDPTVELSQFEMRF